MVIATIRRFEVASRRKETTALTLSSELNCGVTISGRAKNDDYSIVDTLYYGFLISVSLINRKCLYLSSTAAKFSNVHIWLFKVSFAVGDPKLNSQPNCETQQTLLSFFLFKIPTQQATQQV